MFEPNESTRQAIDALYDHCLSLNRGDILDWQTIENITGLSHARTDIREPTLRYIIDRLKRRMQTDRSIVIWIHRNRHNHRDVIGYRLLTDAEAIIIPTIARRERAIRQLNRAINEVSCADLNVVSDHQRRVANAQLKLFKDERRQLREGAKLAITKTTTLPIRTI